MDARESFFGENFFGGKFDIRKFFLELRLPRRRLRGGLRRVRVLAVRRLLRQLSSGLDGEGRACQSAFQRLTSEKRNVERIFKVFPR